MALESPTFAVNTCLPIKMHITQVPCIFIKILFNYKTHKLKKFLF